MFVTTFFIEVGMLGCVCVDIMSNKKNASVNYDSHRIECHIVMKKCSFQKNI